MAGQGADIFAPHGDKQASLRKLTGWSERNRALQHWLTSRVLRAAAGEGLHWAGQGAAAGTGRVELAGPGGGSRPGRPACDRRLAVGLGQSPRPGAAGAGGAGDPLTACRQPSNASACRHRGASGGRCPRLDSSCGGRRERPRRPQAGLSRRNACPSAEGMTKRLSRNIINIHIYHVFQPRFCSVGPMEAEAMDKGSQTVLNLPPHVAVIDA